VAYRRHIRPIAANPGTIRTETTFISSTAFLCGGTSGWLSVSSFHMTTLGLMNDPGFVTKHTSDPDEARNGRAERERQARDALAKQHAPEFVGLSRRDARSLAEGYGLKLRLIDPTSGAYVTADYQWGRVSAVLSNRLRIVHLEADQQRPTIEYGTSFDAPDGTYLVVSRGAPADTLVSNGKGRAHSSGDRVITRDLPDGSTLIVTVEHAHLNDISKNQQQAIADAIDTTPTLDYPKTWLPVTP
jgi:hypothetical protein